MLAVRLLALSLLSGCMVAEPPAAQPPSFEIVAPQLDTITEVSFMPDAGSLEGSLTARWDFDDDGVTDSSGPLGPTTHRFLRVGEVRVRFSVADDEGQLLHEESVLVTIEHPDRWPRTVPTYFMGGFTDDEVTAVLDDPGSARALMVAGFDLWQSITQEDDGSWTVPIQVSTIDAIHEAGLLAYVDVAHGWAPQGFWSDWQALASWLLELAEAGIDGIDFDEFGADIHADDLNQLQDELRAINPHLRVLVTQVYGSELASLLADGATPDYIALAWYIAGPSGFETCTDLAAEYGSRCGYWVDPATYDRIDQTVDEADAVLLWNLCWRPTACGADYPINTWVPWGDVRPLVAEIDGFEP